MLTGLGLQSKLKRVINDISGSTGFELIETSLFEKSSDLVSATKPQVLLEAKCFEETPIDNRTCSAVICRILYLMQQGEEFTETERTDLFFGATRLFQSGSSSLRRLVHLLIKSLNPSPEVAFVVTSSLTKDMGCSCDALRANAFRTIMQVSDAASSLQMERFFKSALVDRNPFVASTALLGGIELSRRAPEVVRRWVNEVSDCVNSQNPMVQFHALALLYELKKSDRLALHRIVASLTAEISKSAIAECILIRYAQKLLSLPGESPLDGSLVGFLEGALRHPSEIVVFEACKALVDLNLTCSKFKAALSKEYKEGSPGSESGRGDARAGEELCNIQGLLDALKSLLSNGKSVVRYAAIRVVYKFSRTYPALVGKLNLDIEPLLTDPSRPVAVLAIIALLKTGPEQRIEKLIKQIANIMADVSDLHRIDIVNALVQLCQPQTGQMSASGRAEEPSRFEDKVRAVVNFLASQLREEGGLNTKRHTMDTLCDLADKNPQVKETVLLHLCDFNEDCEWPALCSHILSYLATEVPKMAHPEKYLRYIFNRVILESPLVRAAAVDALHQIGKNCPEVRKDVIIVLSAALPHDSEDEVRERAVIAIKHLQKLHAEDEASTSAGDSLSDILSTDESEGESALFEEDEVGEGMPFALEAFVEKLTCHLGSESRTKPFDVTVVPTVEEWEKSKEQRDNRRHEREVKGSIDIGDPDGWSSRERPAGGSMAGSGGLMDGVSSGLMDDELDGDEAMLAAAEGNVLMGLEMTSVEKMLPPDMRLGGLSHVTKLKYLTERESEYVVKFRKYFFNGISECSAAGGDAAEAADSTGADKQLIILKIVVNNTLEKVVLENIDILLSAPVVMSNTGSYSAAKSKGVLRILSQTSIQKLKYQESRSIYVLIEYDEVENILGVALQGQLQYILKEDNDYGFRDKYQIEPVTFSFTDFLVPHFVGAKSNRAAIGNKGMSSIDSKLGSNWMTQTELVKEWTLMGEEKQLMSKIVFAKSSSQVSQKVNSILNFYRTELPILPHNEKVPNTAEHFNLIGTYALTKDLIMMVAIFVEHPQHGTLGKILIRSNNPEIRQQIIQALRTQ